ncbi:MAG: hypothetical protein WBR29_12490 [Gammaproteobacteria bacterium]
MQTVNAAGIPVKLDLYEALIRNFQGRIPDAPESISAQQKLQAFLYHHLKDVKVGDLCMKAIFS